jgi:hypothetical protein
MLILLSWIFFALLFCCALLEAFSPLHTAPVTTRTTRKKRKNICILFSGDGIAPGYTWHEEAFEIEVTVKVPKDTRAKDIHFKATPTSIDLRLIEGQGKDEQILLDPDRPLRGKIVLDGTFWVISDPEVPISTNSSSSPTVEPYREVTVTIEKQIRAPNDDFDVIEYDWKGVYKNDQDEVSYRKYDEPEELNVREYAASLGVDIDNINMSLVDKSMFTSGLNITKSSLDSLKEAGLMKEVTRQNDGSEWTTGDDGDIVSFNSMGQGVSKEEVQSTARNEQKEGVAKTSIPFLDTDSPWHKAVPLNQREDFAKNVSKGNPGAKQIPAMTQRKEDLKNQREKDAVDPISTLTVARLREILRERGLKVSGNKKELQERLRAEVQSMLNDDDPNLSA